jgi:hypothetical protein
MRDARGKSGEIAAVPVLEAIPLDTNRYESTQAHRHRTLDARRGSARWDRWRPTVALTQHEDLMVDRLDLLYSRDSAITADMVIGDIGHASPETRVSATSSSSKTRGTSKTCMGRCTSALQ